MKNYSPRVKNAYNSLASEYSVREKYFFEYFNTIIEKIIPYITTGKRVLDIGCGTGVSTNIFNRKGFIVTGVEFSHEMVVRARTINPESNIHEIDFFDFNSLEQYDCVFLSAFLHLFPAKTVPSVLAKVSSLLINEGVLFVSTTISSESKEGWERNQVYSSTVERFRKHWTEIELSKALSSAGFLEMHKYYCTDEYGRQWINFITKKI